jgi:hypothetical protein
MNYLVIKDLIERKTLKQFRAGETYPCSDPARAEFLIKTGYLAEPEKTEEKEQPSAEEKKPKKVSKTAKAPAKRSTKTKKA